MCLIRCVKINILNNYQQTLCTEHKAENIQWTYGFCVRATTAIVRVLLLRLTPILSA